VNIKKGEEKMRDKGIWKILAISVILAIVTSSVAVFSAANLGEGIGEKGIDEGGGEGVISLEMPPFIGVAGASPDGGDSDGDAALREGASLLEEEAGVCAYTKLTPPVNLTIVKTAFKTVEYACGDYIIGSVAVSDDEDEDVHVYVSRDGWLAAYYLEEEPFPKILKNMVDFSDNKLGDALQKVCDALWVSFPEVNYYDFRYPNANKVQIVADEVSDSSDSFRFMIPKEVATNVSKIYWVICSEINRVSIYLDNEELGMTYNRKYGELTFAQPGAPGNIVPSDYHSIKVEAIVSGNGGILLIYRE
jgi:hypothetical protein